MAKTPAPAAVGLRFAVSTPQEFRVGKQIIARYLTGHTYTTTDLNCDFVGKLVADGIATPVGLAGAHKAGGSAVTG